MKLLVGIAVIVIGLALGPKEVESLPGVSQLLQLVQKGGLQLQQLQALGVFNASTVEEALLNGAQLFEQYTPLGQTTGTLPEVILQQLLEGQLLDVLGVDNVPAELQQYIVLPNDTVQSRCYGELGCVTYTPEWYDERYRSYNMFPWSAEEQDIKFWASTRTHPTDDIQLYINDTQSAEDCGFDGSRPTKFIFHGYLNPRNIIGFPEMIQRLLEADDVNVIQVEWSKAAMTHYHMATANFLLVAMQTAALIRWLQTEYSVDPAGLHMIGHSMGAHAAARVASLVPGTGRVTALDPAGPGFEDLPAVVRVDPSDAQFVDVIHSDIRGILNGGGGYADPCGHLDFYPNGGTDQPGCDEPKDKWDILLTSVLNQALPVDPISCRHIRGERFFTDSISAINSCPDLAHECDSYDDYLQGKCADCEGGHCATMGYHSNDFNLNGREHVKMYLTTAKHSPYCKHHYRLVVSLSDTGESRNLTGQLLVSVRGQISSVEDLLLPHAFHGHQPSYVSDYEPAGLTQSLHNVYQAGIQLFNKLFHPNGFVVMQSGMEYGFLIGVDRVLGEVPRIAVTWKPSPLTRLSNVITPDHLNLRLDGLSLLDMDRLDSSESDTVRYCRGSSQLGTTLVPDVKANFYQSQCE